MQVLIPLWYLQNAGRRGVAVGQGVRVGLGVLVGLGVAVEYSRTEASRDEVDAEATASGTVVQIRITATRLMAANDIKSAFERDTIGPFSRLKNGEHQIISITIITETGFAVCILYFSSLDRTQMILFVRHSCGR